MTERETRAILRKAGKRIGQLSAQNAVSESKIHSLESQIEELRCPKTRERVAVDPNTRFANIDAIKKAMDEAAEQEARIKAREPEKEAKRRQMNWRRPKCRISCLNGKLCRCW